MSAIRTKIYWAKFDANGFPIAFYVSDVWPEQPDGLVEITEAQWREFIENQGLTAWSNGAVVPYTPPASPAVYVVTPVQARVTLLNAGLLDTIQNAIDAKGGAIKIKWEYATEIRSDDTDLIAVADDLGIANQIPALFKSAQELVA